jgi:mycoredoxin
MPNEKLIIYGVTWCGDCRRTRKFLELNKIPFDFINIDHDNTGEQYVINVNRGFRSVPTIIFPDGSILVEPSNRQLAQKLQISEN